MLLLGVGFNMYILNWAKAVTGEYVRLSVTEDGEQIHVVSCIWKILADEVMDLVFEYPGLTPMEDTGPLSMAEHIEATMRTV